MRKAYLHMGHLLRFGKRRFACPILEFLVARSMLTSLYCIMMHLLPRLYMYSSAK